MTIETELKLHITPENLVRLKRYPFLRTLSADRARTQKLYSIYYDTAELELHQHAMALRLRRVGKQWIQTLKGGGQVSAGLHQRNEWETPVLSERLDFEALKTSGGELPRGVRNRLQPVFVTDFSRNVRLIDFEGAQIELCMDNGEIRAGQSSCPISELEFELKSGAPQQLFKLALALLDIVPLQVEHTSKAEYGYLLFAASHPAPVKGSFPALHKAQNTASALQAMIVACLAQVQANVPGALLELDEEYLHQVRVGLRRLRVVLAIVRRVHDDAEASALREQVARLCVELGRAREWDVFVTQTLAPICTRLPEHAGLHGVLQASERRRKRLYAETVNSLASADFQRMLLRFGAWLQGEQWSVPGTPLKPFARRILQKQHKRVLAQGAASRENPAQLHVLRIACKKLRYDAEMFGSLFADGGSKAYVAELAALQDALGELHDIAVADLLLHELDSRQRRDTLALIRGWIAHDHVEREAKFSKIWQRFSNKNGFWN
ncbi:MAG: CHAD domain-containing protein [Sideroxyarcus sp.]|nr:CHAD domain-containing protein [Sideroxyarcus sp.]